MELADYIKADREKYCFPSVKGAIDLRQLWDVPLTAKNGFSLDQIARTLHQQVTDMGGPVFVPATSTENPNKSMYENMLNIVKFVIEVRVFEQNKARARAEKAEKRSQLMAVLRDKQDEALRNSSIDEIMKQLAELDA